MANPTKTNNKVDEVIDTSNWVDEQIGFAPYWTPATGRILMGRVMGRDDRDPDFVRYLMQAVEPTDCHRGAKNDEGIAEAVTVSKGEFFSISVYHALRDTFDFYLDSAVRPLIKLTALKEVKTKTVGQTCWTWRLQVSPEQKKLIDAARDIKRLQSDAGDFPPKELSQ